LNSSYFSSHSLVHFKTLEKFIATSNLCLAKVVAANND